LCYLTGAQCAPLQGHECETLEDLTSECRGEQCSPAENVADASEAAADATCFVVGIGINVNRPAQGAFERAVYLSDANAVSGHFGLAPESIPSTPIALQPIAEAVSSAVIATTAAWQDAAFDFAPLTAEYNRQLAILGEQVTVRDAHGTVVASGTVQGVDARGHLLLSSFGSTETVTAGEVTLREPLRE
jgi:biotin-(acetyl-CoA carboxylase) ligase